MKRVVFIIGVSGSGKSTVGTLLASRMNIRFYDGDYFHPASNIKKMANKIALTDEDRWPWLEAINARANEPGMAIFACSALNEKYRQKLIEGLRPEEVLWVVLNGSFEVIDERMKQRSDHFMPVDLLQSQFELWEKPVYGFHIDIEQGLDEIIKHIEEEMNNPKSQFGLIGLGVMGKSLVRNLARKGISLSLYNRHIDGVEEDVAQTFIKDYAEDLGSAKGFDNLEAFVNSIARPRKIMMMVNAGLAVDAVISELRPLLSSGDVIIDGGNSHFKDTERRAAELESIRIDYIGTGVSGGEKGALEGPSIMPGGTTSAYPKVAEYLESIAARDKDNQPCCAYMGSGGSGHFVKMVHNGIEYAEMQLIAEVYTILRHRNGLSPDKVADIFEEWCQADLSSYLLEITYQILRRKEGEKYLIDLILDKAGNKGTGSWTTIAAAELGVPITLITSALYARYTSSFKQERVEASQKYSPLKGFNQQIDIEQLKGAYKIARLINHHQGIHLIEAASTEYNWNLNFPEIARVWTNGCIIRSSLMQDLVSVLSETQRILQYSSIISQVDMHREDLASVVSLGAKSQLALPCFSAAATFINTYSQAHSSANIIQAQRDFFGAHTYKRVDDPNGPSHHTIWETEIAQ